MLISLESNWKQYANKSITIVDFNNMYASTLMENQQKYHQQLVILVGMK